MYRRLLNSDAAIDKIFFTRGLFCFSFFFLISDLLELLAALINVTNMHVQIMIVISLCDFFLVMCRREIRALLFTDEFTREILLYFFPPLFADAKQNTIDSLPRRLRRKFRSTGRI